MIVDALVLAGGRSSRLGGVAKAELIYESSSLLDRTLEAVSFARRIVVVGAVSGLPHGVIVTRESPVFGGPAAAIAAGIAALSDEPPDAVVVVACDMPRVGSAVHSLRAELDTAGDGVIAVDTSGRQQPLAAIYRWTSLSRAVSSAEALDGLSVMALLRGLQLRPVTVAPGSTTDIDTWTDAAAHGIPRPLTAKDTPMVNDSPASAGDVPAVLAEWTDELVVALGIEQLELDIDEVLALAGIAARAVIRPAAPLSTFLVGYAAGIAAARGAVPTEAIAEAMARVREAADARSGSALPTQE